MALFARAKPDVLQPVSKLPEHAVATDSRSAHGILDDFDRTAGELWQVVPNEMLGRLTHPLDDTVLDAVAAE